MLFNKKNLLNEKLWIELSIIKSNRIISFPLYVNNEIILFENLTEIYKFLDKNFDLYDICDSFEIYLESDFQLEYYNLFDLYKYNNKIENEVFGFYYVFESIY